MAGQRVGAAGRGRALRRTATAVALTVVALVGSTTSASAAPPAPTADQLREIKQRIDRLAQEQGAPGEVTAWWADPATSSVVLALNGRPRDSRAAAFVDRAEGLDPAVRIVDGVPKVAPRVDLVGGDAIFIGNSRCSIGFSARTPTGEPRVITAGHCTRSGGEVRGADNVAIGPPERSVFATQGDWAVVAVNPPWSVSSAVAASGAQTVRVTGSGEAAPGTAVCRSGSTTGWRCGEVRALDVTANYSSGPVEGLTLTSACSEPGDSGGSFVAGRTALGMLSGGSGDCSSPGGVSLFQPLDEVLDGEDLTLVTS